MAQVNDSSVTIRFTVTKISELTSSIRSQEVSLQGIPWQVDMKKFKNGAKETLSIYLYCMNRDKSSNWTATACALVKLLPFSRDQKVYEHYIQPFVYNIFAIGYGTNKFIDWDYLLNENNKYVKDDTIKLEVKIEAEDPNSLSRSIPEFECIEKVCGPSCQLTIRNVKNLMAVRTPDFIMSGIPWYIVANKNDYNLGIQLRQDSRTKNLSCQVTMSITLVSSKADVNSIEKSHTQ